DGGAGFLVQAQERRLPAAGGANEFVAVDERRLAVTPAADVTAKLFFQLLVPDLLAGCDLEADQVAADAKGVEQVAVHRRGAARAGVLHFAARADGRGPEFLAVVGVQGDDVFQVFVLAVGTVAHREQPAGGDGRGAVAFAEVLHLPQEGRAVLGP